MTDTDLVNAALILVGESQVSSLDNTQNSTKVQTALTFLPRIKRAVLRAQDWNCARRRAELATVTNESQGEWDYAYGLPADNLAVRRFASSIPAIAFAKFSVELTGEDKPILYTNEISAKIVYTKDLLDVNRWDALLFDAGAARLAIDFAAVFSRDETTVKNMHELYQMKLDEAAGVNAAEGGVERVYSKSILDARL